MAKRMDEIHGPHGHCDDDKDSDKADAILRSSGIMKFIGNEISPHRINKKESDSFED